MEIINKLKEYNKFIRGAWISARVSHEGYITILYTIPGNSEDIVCVFDTLEEFVSSNPAEILKMAGFVRVIDKMQVSLI